MIPAACKVIRCTDSAEAGFEVLIAPDALGAIVVRFPSRIWHPTDPIHPLMFTPDGARDLLRWLDHGIRALARLHPCSHSYGPMEYYGRTMSLRIEAEAFAAHAVVGLVLHHDAAPWRWIARGLADVGTLRGFHLALCDVRCRARLAEARFFSGDVDDLSPIRPPAPDWP